MSQYYLCRMTAKAVEKANFSAFSPVYQPWTVAYGLYVASSRSDAARQFAEVNGIESGFYVEVTECDLGSADFFKVKNSVRVVDVLEMNQDIDFLRSRADLEDQCCQ